MSLINLSLHEAADKLAAGEVTSRQLCEALLAQIDKVEGKVGALVSINNEKALAAADASDARRAAGETLGRYDGLPITIKDNIVEAGEEAKCSSSILDGLENVYDSTVVRKLKEAGCVVFGRANMDEFAMGSTTETSQIKKTSNPHNLDCVPGGSSGGSAAGVASKEFLGALGSDTGGSIRQPASFCGIVGLKPTYGLVSRFGLVAFASSLDQIGPMSKDVQDSALMLDIINGEDEKDSTAIPGKITDFEASLQGADVKGMKLGVPAEYFEVDGMDADVKASVEAAIAKLEAMGAEIVPVSLPHTKYAIATYYVIATAEACTNLARFDGIRYGKRYTGTDDIIETYFESRSRGFGKEVQRRIMLGTYVLSSYEDHKYYHRAQKVRTLIRQDFEKAYEQCDLIVAPVSPETAFKSGESSEDPMKMYLADILTTSANLAGICGISVPCGKDKNDMPIGLQIMGPAMGEKKLLQAAYAYEQNAGVELKEVEL
ncbi:glutamyl-tRNA(Gln) amidotransferase, A subunit [Lentisphaera araneosa HTCC2155]|uniref:Glutamyl-tRNA(Gln) amidotransferase subunit A n=1 Tax=Lentisphaera araneosa HTCC2155 TaxID=313628 RepID=A6DRZ7_9BACT|nr:Asp-tRNA(Asn)/Glu-tRNA(Gln) amidotransferase subunit GatA [Lentisphaera araneosa]EDM25572.1 glutamyl-tRNA(Gln) amidotransferase, A subunit [Lentisphaera araneosa HTCC2155]